MDEGTRRVPVTLERFDHVTGPFFHGTRAELAPGTELVPGFGSNYRAEQALRHVYFSALVPTAAWGAQLAAALADEPQPGRIYVVEPTGPFEDDPNVTDKRFPGNPTQSYRSQHPVRVVRELVGWEPHPPEALEAMLASLARLREQGLDVIED